MKPVEPLRVLLLGAGGQLGRELLSRLTPLGTVATTVHQPSSVPELATARVVDLTDEQQVRSAVRDARPNLIVNAAAYTAVDRAESDREACWRANALAPCWLAEEAQRLNAALIHYSTDYVFDGSGTGRWREDDPTGPLNYYGESKLAGELAIRAACNAHLILRTSWVYGQYGKNFVATMLRMASRESRLRVVSDQVGAPSSADMLADVTCQLIGQVQTPIAGWLAAKGGVVHLAGQGETNWHAFACEIFRQARVLGVPLAVHDVAAIQTSDYPTPAQRPLNSRLSLDRLRERFGIVPPDWPQSLAKTLPAIVRSLAS